MWFANLEQLFSYPLPGIPRFLTALTEWGACAIIIMSLRCRLSKRTTMLWLLGILPVQILLRCLGSYEAGPFQQAIFILGMVVNLGFMFLCIGGLSKEPAQVVCFWWAAAFLLAEFTASLSWHICGSFLLEPSMLSLSGALLSLCPVIVCNGLVFYQLSKHKYAESECTWNLVGAALSVVILTFVASNAVVFGHSFWDSTSPPALLTSVSLIRTVVDLTGITFFWLILKNQREKQMGQEMVAINGIIDLQYQQYLDFRERSAYIARQCHDLKHHVDALRKICTVEERETYLTDLEDSISRYGFFCNTGSPVLDMILTQKMLRCQQLDIQLGYSADAKRLDILKPIDLCTLFGNLLDNAIECVQDIVEKERRQILVTVEFRNRFLYISVENCCDKEIARQVTLPETTKEDQRNHGYGGKSIAYTVEKYDGTFQIQSADGWFTASILIPANVPEVK